MSYYMYTDARARLVWTYKIYEKLSTDTRTEDFKKKRRTLDVSSSPLPNFGNDPKRCWHFRKHSRKSISPPSVLRAVCSSAKFSPSSEIFILSPSFSVLETRNNRTCKVWWTGRMGHQSHIVIGQKPSNLEGSIGWRPVVVEKPCPTSALTSSMVWRRSSWVM